MKIVFLERNTFRVEFPRPIFPHEWIEFSETAPDEIVSRLHGADIAIVNKLPLRRMELERLASLKLIAVAATGVDNIDLDYCSERGIAVSNTRNYAVHSLPEHVFMVILALRRGLISYREDVIDGKWEQAKQFCLLNAPINDLFGSTLGIVGYGVLGKAVGRLAEALGMKVMVAERRNASEIRPERLPFEKVLEMSDVLTLHSPLTEETRGLIGRAELRAMKPNAILINTARGGLVNEHDLLEALREQRIAGAALDVLSAEPPRNGNVLLNAKLPNLLITPHIAWASKEAMQTLARQLIDTLESFMRGERLNRVV